MSLQELSPCRLERPLRSWLDPVGGEFPITAISVGSSQIRFSANETEQFLPVSFAYF
jgi:hypothetical protein